MDLLLFYIQQIFEWRHFPLPNEICAGADSIAPMCNTTVWFTLIYTLLIIIYLGFFCSKRIVTFFPVFFVGAFSVLSCFILADTTMKQIEDPGMFGLEWFALLYFLWIFIIVNNFNICLLFPAESRRLVTKILALTFIATLIFAYLGRGNFEHITFIAGGLFAKLSWPFLWMSLSFKALCFIAIDVVVLSCFMLLGGWLRSGLADHKIFLQNLKILFIYIIILIIPAASIPLGEMLNKNDVRQAKEYVDALKPAVDKYYYENGEYPKFIEKMLPAGPSPKLLARHEFFTAGIRGTYYFSRSDKYCFLFQNPARKFGYYSLTSERGWRFSEVTGSYDDVFINLCDESMKNYEDLISQHLGVDGQGDIVEKIAAEAGLKPDQPITQKASKILEEKILEESKKDPSLLKYFKPSEENNEEKK
jgi:hypothetical protein